MKACGLSETVVADTSVTYAPVSASFDSVTIRFYDGTRHVLTGCRGSVTFNFVAGQFPVASFNFIGIYNNPSDTALSGTFTVANQAAALELTTQTTLQLSTVRLHSGLSLLTSLLTMTDI